MNMSKKIAKSKKRMVDIKKIPSVATAVIKAKLGIKTPLKVTQYVTYKCNLNCSFCGRRGSSNELSLDEIKKIMDNFKKMGTLFWGFNGGEPLLRKDIGDIVSYAKSLGFKTTMSTNGILIPKKLDVMKKLDAVLVSIDGDEKDHDAVRGKGNYKKAVEGIKLLRKNGIKTIIWSVVNKSNYNKIESMLALAEKHGCDLEIQPICRHKEDKAGKANDYLLGPDEVSQAADWLIKQKKGGRPVSNSYGYLELMKENQKHPDCFASRLFCTISPEGNVVPCADFLYTGGKFKNCRDGCNTAFGSLKDMSKCRNCSFSCYMEYNILLNSLTKTGFRAVKNILKNEVFWK